MAGILATLGGIPLELANGDPGWLITSGVVPYRRAFEVHKDTAAQLMELSGEPVELFLPATSDDGEDRTIKQLYVMRSMPGSHPDKRRVEVADQRVYWPDVHVERDYNVRRNAGDTFLEGDNFNAAELELTEIYVPTSIVEGVPYTALEAVIDVLSELTFRSGNSFSFQDDVPDHVMEELKLRDNGDAAVARVLREFPGVSVYPHPDGDIRVYDQHRNTLEAFSGDVTQTESASLSGFHWPGFGSADVAVFSDRRGERAPLVRVLFGCRHEMLLVGTDSGSVTLGPGANAFRVLNVAPSPDRFLEAVPTRLTADGQLKVRNLSELTWCEFGLQATEGLLKAWSDDEVSNGVLTIADGGLGSLTQAILRSHRASGFQFVWDDFVNLLATTNNVWAARFGAVFSEWRWTWAIDPHWWGLIDSLLLRRLAVSNRILGHGVRSPVYMDHTLRPTRLAEVRGRGGLQEGARGELVFGSIVKALTGDPESPQAGPFVLVPRALSSGVFSVRPTGDAAGERDQVLPGVPLEDKLPARQLGNFNRDPDTALALWDFVQLAEGFQMQTIVSIVPASPNSKKRLHVEEVNPLEVEDLIGAEVGPCRAPVVEIYVPPNLMSADFAWNDFDSLKGTLEDGDAPDRSYLVNGNAIRQLALAVAAAYYDPLVDRPFTNGMQKQADPFTVPAGSITEVEHTLGKTTIRALELPRAGSYWRYLDDGTRKVILRSLSRGPGDDLHVT